MREKNKSDIQKQKQKGNNFLSFTDLIKFNTDYILQTGLIS